MTHEELTRDNERLRFALAGLILILEIWANKRKYSNLKTWARLYTNHENPQLRYEACATLDALNALRLSNIANGHDAQT